ncbi:hypothetical protein DEMA109039_22105 [Deinococcus marmoris]
MSVPQGKIALAFTGQQVTGEEQVFKLLSVLWGQFWVKSSDAGVYTR